MDHVLVTDKAPNNTNKTSCIIVHSACSPLARTGRSILWNKKEIGMICMIMVTSNGLLLVAGELHCGFGATKDLSSFSLYWYGSGCHRVILISFCPPYKFHEVPRLADQLNSSRLRRVVCEEVQTSRCRVDGTAAMVVGSVRSEKCWRSSAKSLCCLRRYCPRCHYSGS